MANKNKSSELKLPVTKQTVGGVTGAVLGGMVGGPVGAIVGGVAGALVGEASAEGKQPMKKALDRVKALGRSRPARAALTKAKALRQPRKNTTRAVRKTTGAKSRSAKRKTS